MAFTRICVILCALISLSSSHRVLSGGCSFKEFSAGWLRGRPQREIDWTQHFLDNELYIGDALNGITFSPLAVRELLIKAENTVNDLSVNAERSLQCAIINATKVTGFTLGGKYVADVFVAAEEIRELTVKSKIVHEVTLLSNFTTDGRISRVFIDGHTVKGIHADAINFTDNKIDAAYLTDFRVNAHNIKHNTIKANSGGAYKVAMKGKNIIDDTHVEAFELDELNLYAHDINNTHIVGSQLSGMVLDARVLNNTNITGEHLRDMFIVGASYMENFAMKASTVKNVRVIGGSGMDNVDIAVTGIIDDLVIEVNSSSVKNVHFNGFSVPARGSFLYMKCADKFGYPIEDEELGGLNKCFNKYCQTMCAGKYFTKNGKCFGRTCCCMV